MILHTPFVFAEVLDFVLHMAVYANHVSSCNDPSLPSLPSF